MPKSLSSAKRFAARPTATPQSATARVRQGRRWPLVAGVVVLVAVSAAVTGFWRRHRALQAPAASAAMALHPVEARLLGEAARAAGNPRPYLDLAEEYAASTRPASALWAYSEAEARVPSDDAIRLKVAAAVRQLGYPVVAESIIRSVRAGRGAAAALARLDLADLLIATGRATAARAALSGAGPAAELARGRVEEAMGDEIAAAESYQRAGAAGDADGYERLARLDMATGRIRAARAALRGLESLRPGVSEDLLLIAAAQAEGGTPHDRDLALTTLLRDAQLRPRDAEVYYQAGLIFQRQGNRVPARVQFERAVKLNPYHAAARGRLADLLQAMGQTAQAHWERAHYYALTDQPDRSLVELRRAGAAGYPNDVDRALMAARTAGELQQIPAAVKEDQSGLKRHPGDPNLMLQLGLTYQLSAPRNVFERHCREWMALQPASGMPYWLLGRGAVADAREQDAIRLFETACAKEPDNADFCVELGNAYTLVPAPENVVKARAWLEKAVSLNPASAEAHQKLGHVLEQAGELEAARRQYLESLDVQPGQVALLNNLVQLSTRLQRPVAARLFTELAQTGEAQARERQRLSRRVRDYPGDGAARIDLARFLIRSGQLEAARNQLVRAAEPGPAAATARQTLAEVERWLRVWNG